eukprot:6206333-Pleurochrysis_carterae.AAC.1
MRRTGCLPRSGYSPRPRWNCCRCGRSAVEVDSVVAGSSVDGVVACASGDVLMVASGALDTGTVVGVVLRELASLASGVFR